MAGMVQVPFGHAMVTRAAPLMDPQFYRTFGMSMPLRTHWRPASCQEVRCDHHTHGWVTTVDMTTDLGRKRYDFITHDRSRRYSMQRVSDQLVKFVFGPGQECYRAAEHQIKVGRPPRLYVRDGDWRGNPNGTPVRVHRTAADWVDEFATHQDRLATARQRG